MQTLSSARRTCMASASAVEWTATVAMPSSLQARSTLSAISPRLAIRILSNIPFDQIGVRLRSFDDHQRFSELDRLTVLEQNLQDRSRARCGDLVHRLHSLDNQERIIDFDHAANIDERLGARLRSTIGGADHGGKDG